MNFIFDENPGLLDTCIEFYNELKPRFPERKRAVAGAITAANDKYTIGIQAADLLVGQLTTSIRNRKPEKHYKRLWKAHSIYETSGYPSEFAEIPDLIELFNHVWKTTLQNREREKAER